MKLRFLVGLFLVILIGGSGCVATTLKITDIKMARGVDEKGLPVGVTIVFPPDSEAIYSWFSYKFAPPNTILKGSWYYEGKLIADSVVELKESSDIGFFRIRRTTEKLLATGNYRVDISIGNKVLESASFSIQ